MTSPRSRARRFATLVALLTSTVGLLPVASAQGLASGTPRALPGFSGEVRPLSPEDIAAIPVSTALRREAGDPNGLSAGYLPQAIDVEARLAQSLQGVASGAVFVVDYLGDTDANDVDPGNGLCADSAGRCGLRTAIQEANALRGLDTIVLPEGVITLAAAGADENAALTGDLDITEGLIVQGRGASRSVVDGNGAVTGDRVFHVLQSSGGYITADFVDLSIQGGSVSGSGGGILAACRADVVVRRSNILENFGSTGGGLGVLGSGCTADILPRMVVYDSAVYRNTANSNLAGAGIDQFGGGTLSVINSTIAENVNSSTSVSAVGGISVSSNTPNTATLRSSTIIDNSAPNATAHEGVGLRIGSAATATLIDNLIGFNTFNGGTANCSGSAASTSLSSGGGNLYSTGTVTCPVTASDSTGNGFTLVGALAFNAPGQTPTAAVSSLSAARAFGRSCILPQDQRGVERPLRACSSGAYQFVATPSTPEIFDNGFE